MCCVCLIAWMGKQFPLWRSAENLRMWESCHCGMDGGEGDESRGRCCAWVDKILGAFGWPENGTDVYKGRLGH